MHSSAIYKGYALYKIDGKNALQQQNSKWCPFSHNCLLRVPFITIQRYATYFFIMCFFSKHVNISVFLFFACLWDSDLPFYFVYYFHSVLSYWSGHVLFKLVFNLIHFSFIGDSEKQ